METKVNELLAVESTDKEVKNLLQVNILREINRLILTKYMIQIDDNFCLYPIEVEAYYYHKDNFPDTTVHKNVLQKNRFGQLYFHRAGRKEEHALLLDEGGVDICMSSGEYYFGILIRSAWINEKETPICGPGLLTREIVQHITGKNIIDITEDDRPIIEEAENKVVLAKLDGKDIRKEYQPADEYPIIEGQRFGINEEKHAPYSKYKLRALIGLKKEKHPFKDKIKMVISYFEEAGGEMPCENIKKILGWEPKKDIDQFKCKKAEK